MKFGMADQWQNVAPFVTDEWTTVKEISSRSGRGKGPIIYGLSYGVQSGFVEERRDPEHKRKQYRKRPT